MEEAAKIALVIVVTLVACMLISSWRSENLRTVALFYRKNCGHCKKFMKPGGQWEKFKKMCMMHPSIDALEISTLDPRNAQATKKYASEGVPSIIIFGKNGNEVKYSGPRTAIDLYRTASKN